MDHVCTLWSHLINTVMTRGKVLDLNRISGFSKAAVVLLSDLFSVEFELPLSPTFASRREPFFSFCLAVGQQVDIQSYCSKWESVKTICESALLLLFGVPPPPVNKSFVILTRNRTDVYMAPSRFWFGKHQRECLCLPELASLPPVPCSM